MQELIAKNKASNKLGTFRNLNVSFEILKRLRNGKEQAGDFIFLKKNGSVDICDRLSMAERIEECVLFFRDYGIGDEDKVLLVPENKLDAIAIFLALIYVGAQPCFVPYFTPSSRSRLLEIIRDASVQIEASAIIASNETSAKHLRPVSEYIPIIKPSDINKFSRQNGSEPLEPTPSKAPIAYLQLTSGTTGASRAIQVPHEALMHQCRASASRLGFCEHDVVVGWLPLNHDMGLISQVFLPLLTGAKAVSIAPTDWLAKPHLLFESIDAYRGTTTWMPNFAFNYLLKRVPTEKLRSLDLSTWRLAINGSEMVRPQTVQNFKEFMTNGGFKKDILISGYGLGENVLVVTVRDPGSSLQTVTISASELSKSSKKLCINSNATDSVSFVSCGKPIDGCSVEIIDEDGNLLPDRTVGEIVVSGRSLCSSYIGSEASQINARNGFFTGDLGLLHDGELYVLGRKKEIAIVAGRNINPSAISGLCEKVLEEHHRRSCAFSVFDEELGTERLVLVVEISRGVPDPEIINFEKDIRALVSESLGVTLSDIVFKVNSWLPKTSSGKVSIPKAREKYLEELDNSSAESAHQDVYSDQTYEAIMKLCKRALGLTSIDSRQSLFEQGLDSLRASTLILELERVFQIEIGNSFFDDPSVEFLSKLVEEELGTRGRRSAANSAGESGSLELEGFVQEFERVLPQKKKSKSRIDAFIRNGPSGLVGAIDYRTGIKLQKSVTSLPQVRQRLESQLELFKEFRSAFGIRGSLEEAVNLTLMSNTFALWRSKKLCNEKEFVRNVRIISETEIRKCFGGDRGVVFLLPHVDGLYAPIVKFLTDKMKRKVATLRHEAASFGTEGRRRSWERANRAKQVSRALGVLKEGGFVFVAGDGRKGDERLTVPFFGGELSFPTGPAIISAQSGALLIPLFPLLRGDGAVDYVFKNDIISDVIGKADAVEIAVRRYAHFYEGVFGEMHQSLRWKTLSQFMGEWARRT